MYGPLVLAGRLGAQSLTRDMTYGGYDCELHGDPVAVPEIAAAPQDPAGWVERAPGALEFRTKGQAQSIAIVPLNRIQGERYAVYWKVHDTNTKEES